MIKWGAMRKIDELIQYDMENNTMITFVDPELENMIVSLVNAAKVKVAVSVNATLTELYWKIGNLINTAILENKRADYGANIVKNISKTLTQKFGNGWSVKQIHRIMQFAKEFASQKVATLWRQLTWSHIKQLLPIDDPLKRDFYIEMC